MKVEEDLSLEEDDEVLFMKRMEGNDKIKDGDDTEQMKYNMDGTRTDAVAGNEHEGVGSNDNSAFVD